MNSFNFIRVQVQVTIKNIVAYEIPTRNLFSSTFSQTMFLTVFAFRRCIGVGLSFIEPVNWNICISKAL